MKRSTTKKSKSSSSTLQTTTPTPRNPLKDLNTTRSATKTTSSNACSSSNNNRSVSSTSSSYSIEAPKGCLRFFLSKNQPKPFKSTPKSLKPPKMKRTPSLNHSENSKDLSFSESQHAPHPKWSFGRMSDEENNDHTPMVKKVVSGSGVDRKNVDVDENATTPPVEASISPEIQCGSTFTSSKSTCFGAGHILSGVTDKRKCRPRGILAVEGEKDLGYLLKDGFPIDDDDDSFRGFVNNSRLSLIPAPIEASMHWILPPGKDESDYKENVEDGSTPFHSPSSLCSSGRGLSSDMSLCSGSTSNMGNSGRSACLVSPCADLDFEGFLGSEGVMSKEKKACRFESPLKKMSPSSGKDSLGSYNVICTPQSNSSSNGCVVELPWLKNVKESWLEFDRMSNIHPATSLSPKSRISMWDPDDVLPLPGFSFQFTPRSNVIDKTQPQKNSNDWPTGILNASCGNSSQSEMRISWRDGLVNRIFEMDDLDCCRLLSDEEEEEEENISCKLDENVVLDQSLSDKVLENEVVSEQPETDKPFNGKVLEISSSCAESISTEGGGELITSRDSGWNLCYENHLFRE
ncbi:hypothetical protein IFM89_033840 [Coptis chinensis]|uniref:Uncharacterized protein n=1 Tax=Coptis chinensis TaxID=261450 RepID=A0A835LPY6_9MAGN|nr:hypothetical protein IFM89_033840 [Coptis chinensis]